MKREYHVAYQGISKIILIGVPMETYQDALWELRDIERDDPDMTYFIVSRQCSDWSRCHE